MRSTIKTKFIKDFAEQEFVSTQEMFEWYKKVKVGSGAAYRSAIYILLIEPLTQTGELEQVSKGLYRITSILPKEELDEWDDYIQNKLKEV